jgi:hypothetical protein
MAFPVAEKPEPGSEILHSIIISIPCDIRQYQRVERVVKTLGYREYGSEDIALILPSCRSMVSLQRRTRNILGDIRHGLLSWRGRI